METARAVTRRLEAILFDLGNTLIAFDGDLSSVLEEAVQALVQALAASGFPLDASRFGQDFRFELEAYYREREIEFLEHTTLYVLRRTLERWEIADVPEMALRQALAAMYAVTQSHWQVEDDAHAVLTALQQAGFRLGLISNAGDDQDVQTLVDQAGLRRFFEVIVSSAALGIRKPNPRIFQIVLDRMGIPPDRAAMVGDTLGADVLGAQHAGLLSIWLTRRANTPQNQAHRDTIQPDIVIDRLADLPGVLLSP
jgi:putative hydrolase of the HAD superfamily